VLRYLRVAVPRIWAGHGPVALLLYPLTLIHRLYRGLRAIGWRLGLTAPQTLTVPVVVVGNLNVGGSGKTPLVIHLVHALREAGYHPGVIARGYGGSSKTGQLVGADSDPLICGDEPLLIHFLTRAPVAVGADRVAVARHLLQHHPECDLILADDGLQHRRLHRDLEIALLNEAGLGNRWLLPAGPLRDPLSRLKQVDAVVLNGVVDPIRIHSPFFRMQTHMQGLTRLAPSADHSTLAELAQRQSSGPLRILAVCAIGNPDRFFQGLRDHGLTIDTKALPDHDPIQPTDLRSAGPGDLILITEKDAVKCARDDQLSVDPRIWVVSLGCQVDPGLLTFITDRLKGISDGSQTP
jgi:tetraacyldisaccharide 4'-kinase